MRLGRTPVAAYDRRVTGRCLVSTIACLAVALTAATAPAGAATPPQLPKAPKVKTRIAKVQISLSGYVETRKLHDTTSDCYPGERWVQTNRYDFSTGGFVDISMKRVIIEGRDPIVTSAFSRRAGSAKVAGGTSEYRTTNYCSGEQRPVAEPPACSSTSGKTSVSLQEGVVPNAGDDELAPLTQIPLLLAIARNGGGRDPVACVGPGAGSLAGQGTERAVVTTSIAPGVALAVPSGLSVMKVFNIRPGQRLRRTTLLSGPCSKVNVTSVPGTSATPAQGNLNADSDCFLTGRVASTITPRPKKQD